MAFKYECYYCKEIYPAEEAIDGYNQGYEVGFLCPKCGKNVQAGLRAKQKISTEQYIWRFISFILFLPIAFTMDSEIVLAILGREINLNTFLFIAWIVFVVVLMLLKPSLIMATTFLTKPTDKR
jgi:hypothetical protein